MQIKLLSRLAAATAAVALFLLAGTAAPAQTESPAPAPAASPAPAVESKTTLLERIRQGGWVMIPIGLCSVLTVYLIGEGYTRTSAKRVAPPTRSRPSRTSSVAVITWVPIIIARPTPRR